MATRYRCRLLPALALLLALLCAAQAAAQVRTRGIDVSKYQGTINWSKVAKDSTIRFVYIKATEGTSIQDPMYRTNLKGAKKAGLLVGSYHLYSSRTTAYQQMGNIRKVILKKEQDLVPVLDIEGHHSGRLNMERVDKLLELMEKEYGVKPIIYTSEKLYKTHFATKKYQRYHIFIANYRSYPTTRFTLWQYTERGHCAGISGYVDFSRLARGRTLNDILMPKPKKKTAEQAK
ncbi:MAG: glycosyl hydrolase family 25 [Bacteroidales bacterium]|nr:glycosyl hydrolase family 25 [Bacteroidales bacterium]